MGPGPLSGPRGGEWPPHRIVELDDPASGLRAVIVLDSVALGPAAGGVRTWRYARWEDAVTDARRLARAMTVKCALAGLDAGGGKAVVWDHGRWDRAAGFERLGQAVEELGGAFRTAGDLGTTDEDLARMARHTGFVHRDGGALAGAVARGLLACAAACLARRGRAFDDGLRVAVQGAGAIGAAAARALAARGASLVIADLHAGRAAALAAELGAETAAPERILAAEVDLVAPCAAGGVLDEAAVRALRAWAVVGGANNQLADRRAARLLCERGLLHVPDALASAGAVIQGIGRSVMGLADPGPLIDRLGLAAGEILEESAARRVPADEIALERARGRLAADARDAV